MSYEAYDVNAMPKAKKCLLKIELTTITQCKQWRDE